jgi:hypothetical protein
MRDYGLPENAKVDERRKTTDDGRQMSEVSVAPGRETPAGAWLAKPGGKPVPAQAGGNCS